MFSSAYLGTKRLVQDRHLFSAIQPCDQKIAPGGVHVIHLPDIATHSIAVRPAADRTIILIVRGLKFCVFAFVVGHEVSSVNSRI